MASRNGRIKSLLAKLKHTSGRAIRAIDREFQMIPSKWIRDQKQENLIVFVHGLLSEGDRAWQSSKARWFDIVTSDDSLSEWDVLCGEWYTTAFSGEHDVKDAANKLMSELSNPLGTDHAPALDRKKIIFVCHSMGGLVVRKMLIDNPQILEGRFVSCYTLSTPAYGVKLPNLVRSPLLPRNALVDDLEPTDEELLAIDHQFRQLVQDNPDSLTGLEAYEEFMVAPRLGFLVPVYEWIWAPAPLVSKKSQGSYFGTPVLIKDSDHRSISRPANPSAQVHQILKDLATRITKERLR